MNEVIQNLKINATNGKENFCQISEKMLNAIKELSKREYEEMQQLKERVNTLKETQLKQLNIIQQRDEVINEAIEIAKGNWSNCIYCEGIAEVLQKYKGDNK